MSPLFLVADMKRSIEFYTNVLGFDVDFLYEDFYAGITKNSFSIHLKERKSLSKEKKNQRNNEDIDITFSVDNIEDLYEELTNKSIQIIQSLRNMPYGKEFYVADPDDNIISFLN